MTPPDQSLTLRGFDVRVVLPDNDTEGLASCLMTVGSGGGVSSLNSTLLLTPAEIDAAVNRSPAYRAPGT